MTTIKYHSKKSKCAVGHTHDSVKEARRCNELHMMQKSGIITDLQVQVKFELIPTQKFKSMPNERSCSYVADFTYFKDGIFIIEDTKGYKTTDYRIKRKLMKHKYCGDERAVFLET